MTRLLLVYALLTGTIGFLLRPDEYSGNGETPTHWRGLASNMIKQKARLQLNVGVAKNVIMFIGDGMGISTVTAGRILKGQLAGQTGEEEYLSFENFPYTGLSKTYSQDSQVTDSASASTSYFCGVKANIGTLGLDGRSTRGQCSTQHNYEISSILDWSIAAGKSVGFVTTARVTHATPAGLYANIAERHWEGDIYTRNQTGGCKDIAAQLVDDYKQMQVILGGGREFFQRFDQMDPERGDNSRYGRRDGRDLIQEWKTGQHGLNRNSAYVWNETAFNQIDPTTTDSVLGLFEQSHMQYDYDRFDPRYEKAGEPSIANMTELAIKILSKNPNGYFLMVEGAKIDHGHHEGRAKLALYDVLAFEKAVDTADRITSETDTLTIVTADHGHTLSISGYPSRGNGIFDKVDTSLAQDGKPYTTLLYANGQGYRVHNGSRPDITNVDTTIDQYQQEAAVPLAQETHSGEDVAIYARGPMSHLLTGVHEDSNIAGVMAYASCVGAYSNYADCAASLTSG
ncbi:hypothetical protein ACF0H5_005400 [Mactra antiquata]